MTKKKLYSWMDKQIKANELQAIPVDVNDPYYIKNAQHTEKKVHVFNIDNLCKELNIEYETEDHSTEFYCHYIMYKGYKFFGLVSKEEEIL